MGWLRRLFFLVGLVGCSESKVDLLLDLQTDLVPLAEFTTVRTELFSRIPASDQVADGSLLRLLEIEPDANVIQGTRIAVFRGLAPGTHVARVRLIGTDGRAFVQRIVLMTLHRTSVFTVPVTRDCRGVVCPLAGDDPSLTECLNGRCVRPECTPERLEFCPSLSCEVGVDCVASAPCARAVCTAQQICLRTGSGCGPSQYCNPDTGCEPLTQRADAGVILQDGGGILDASGPLGDGSPLDAAPDTAADGGLAPFFGTLEAYAKASNTEANERFGDPIALSADGLTLAVGAPAESSAATGIDGDATDNSSSRSGAVYVFARSGSTWSQQAYIKASNTDPDDEFGRSVALSADGLTLAVGAALEDSSTTGIDGNQTDNSAFQSGAVYVFSRSGSTWSQQAYVKASNTEGSDAFGWSVALSADGSTLAVGARNEDSGAAGIDGNQADNSTAWSGAVYVFSRSGSTWSQQAYVKASSPGANDQFGESLVLSADGSTLAVGVPSEDSAATGLNGNEADDSAPQSGAVYVFSRSGSTWSQQAYAKASHAEANDRFGAHLALSSDGSTMAVGAPLEDSSAIGIDGDPADNAASDSGAVYVFSRTGQLWSQQAYIKSFNAEASDGFGSYVALSSDGSILVAGAPLEDSSATGIDGDPIDNSASGSGAAYLFVQSGSVWNQRSYVKASNTEPGDQFGARLGLSGDGSVLVVAAPFEDSASLGTGGDPVDNTAMNSGAVYVYGP